MKAAPPGENPVYPNRLGFVRITHADRPPIRWPARVVIYLNDHRPAHVHVIGAEGEAAFILHCPDGPPELRESYGFSRPDVGRIKDALAAVLATLCDEWRKLHGGD